MRHAEHGVVTFVLGAIAIVAILFLLLPILMMVPLSLESGRILRFPPHVLSMHWYADYLHSPDWLASTLLSVEIAAGAALLATITGTCAAIGLQQAQPRARALWSLLLLSPMLLPTIVVAIAVYGMYASLHLIGRPLGLVLAHAVLTMPFALLNTSTALARVPRSLSDAAMSLGAGPAATIRQVIVPQIRRGMAAGAVFAFMVSFDEVVLAKFLSGASLTTLPKRMLDGMFYEISPMLAAVSVLLVGVNLALALAGLALVRAGRGRRRNG